MKTPNDFLHTLAAAGEWGRGLLLLALLPIGLSAQITKDNCLDYLHGTFDITSGGGDETDIKQYFRVEFLDDVFGHRFTVYGRNNETGKDFAEEYTFRSVRGLGKNKNYVVDGFIYGYTLDAKRDTIAKSFQYRYLKPEGYTVYYVPGHTFKLARTSAVPVADQPVLAQQISKKDLPQQAKPAQQAAQPIQQAKPQQAVQPVQQAVEVKQPARPTTTPAQAATPVPSTTPVNTTVSGRKVGSTQSGQTTPTTSATPSSTTPVNTTVSGRKVEPAAQTTQPAQTTAQPKPGVPTTIEEGLAILADPKYAWMVDDEMHTAYLGKKFSKFYSCRPIYYTIKPDEGKTEIRGRARPVGGSVRANNVYISDGVSKVTFADPTSGNFTLGIAGVAVGFRNLSENGAEFFLNIQQTWVKARRVLRSDLPK